MHIYMGNVPVRLISFVSRDDDAKTAQFVVPVVNGLFKALRESGGARLSIPYFLPKTLEKARGYMDGPANDGWEALENYKITEIKLCMTAGDRVEAMLGVTYDSSKVDLGHDLRDVPDMSPARVMNWDDVDAALERFSDVK